MSDEKVYAVGELTRGIRRLLEQGFPRICVEGEMSGFRQAGSGHCYFDLKDEKALLHTVLFKGQLPADPAILKNGALLRVHGRLSVYDARGQYQLTAQSVEPAGEGALQKAFEELKKRLQAEGLFDAGRKRPLPMLPQRIAVVTSRTGAAIRDIISVLTRRFPNIDVLLIPVLVQGAGAAEKIARAINYCSKRGDFDVLIVGRGGGSMEDLWCFNEEVVARAVYNCSIPVVSAVGHEIDFSICDFVADVRAATPSAAAELAVSPRSEYEQHLEIKGRRMERALQLPLQRLASRLQRAAGSVAFAEPRRLLERNEQHLDALGLRMIHAVERYPQQLRQRLERVAQQMLRAAGLPSQRYSVRLQQVGLQLDHHLQQCLNEVRASLAAAGTKLDALSPLAVLDRGYSVTRLADGSVLTSEKDVQPGARIVTRLADGEITSTVEPGD